jgi:hypothetical protein
MKLDDVKQLLNPVGIGNFLVKGLFGELKGLPQGEKEAEKEGKEPESGREEKGLMKVFHILSGVFQILKGAFGKVAGAINKILPSINISNKPWFDPFSMMYAGAQKLKEAAGSFATSMPSANRIQAKIDSALLPEWGNTRMYEAVIEVPKDQVLNIGKVAEQYTKTGTKLAGQADQILLPQNWPLKWIKEIRVVPSIGGKYE